jgi:hypothetical protein
MSSRCGPLLGNSHLRPVGQNADNVTTTTKTFKDHIAILIGKIGLQDSMKTKMTKVIMIKPKASQLALRSSKFPRLRNLKPPTLATASAHPPSSPPPAA